MNNQQGYSKTKVQIGFGESTCLGSGACCINFEVAKVPGYPTLQEKRDAEQQLMLLPAIEESTPEQLDERQRLTLLAMGRIVLDKPEAEMSEAEVAKLPVGYKPMGRCRWLVSADKDENGKWQPAKCLLHAMTSVYPRECAEFAMPSSPWGGPCAMGGAVWKQRLQEGDKAPDEISGYFEV